MGHLPTKLGNLITFAYNIQIDKNVDVLESLSIANENHSKNFNQVNSSIYANALSGGSSTCTYVVKLDKNWTNVK